MEFFQDTTDDMEDNGRQTVLFVVDYNKFDHELLSSRLKDLFYENIKHKIGCIIFNHPLASLSQSPEQQQLNALEKQALSDGIFILLPIQEAKHPCYLKIKAFKATNKSTHKSDFLKVLSLVCNQIQPLRSDAKNIVFVTDDDYDVNTNYVINRLKDIQAFNSECQLIGMSNLSSEMTRDVNVFDSKPKKASSDTVLVFGALLIGIKVYMLYKQFTKPKMIKLTEHHEMLPPSKKRAPVVAYQFDEFGKKANKINILYTPEERVQLRNSITETGIEILSFVDLNELPLGLRESRFIFPADHKVANSTKIFTALLQACLNLKKGIIVRYRASKIQVPRLGYLIPRKEVVHHGNQVAPSGFYMIEVAVSDDTRDPAIPEPTTVPDSLIDGFSELLIKSKVDDYLNIKDPLLCAQRQKLESLLLHEMGHVQNDFEIMKTKVALQVPEILGDLMAEHHTKTVAKRTTKVTAPKSKKKK